MKHFLKNPVNIIILITCLILAIHFGYLICKELKPKTHNEQVIECLNLGSDYRAKVCISLLSN